MKIKVNIQHAADSSWIPENKQIRKWVKTALARHDTDMELTVRIVDEDEGAELNRRWRKAKGPTNVLSFPYTENKSSVQGLLGDIVICAPVLEREAKKQNKSLESHWAHIVIHGTLHLLGYDHIKPDEAEKMENLEISLLAVLGYTNPYCIIHTYD